MKRPILLVEVLIALSLVALIGTPLLTQPLVFYKKQVESLLYSVGERLADEAFLEVKERLYKRQIPWASLPSKGAPPLILSLQPREVFFPNLLTRSLACQAEISYYRSKETRNGEVRLYNVTIFLNGKSYAYKVTVRGIRG
jgi:hypothetical protein